MCRDCMEFRLAEGPWKEMFKGVFEDYGVEIYSNPESVILVSILEKEADVVKGAVVELYKVFSAKGELQGFMTAPVECTECIGTTERPENW